MGRLRPLRRAGSARRGGVTWWRVPRPHHASIRHVSGSHGRLDSCGANRLLIRLFGERQHPPSKRPVGLSSLIDFSKYAHHTWRRTSYLAGHAMLEACPWRRLPRRSPRGRTHNDDANAIEARPVRFALVACTRVGAAGKRNCRRGQRHIRSRPARGHRRSIQPGIAGESSQRRHRWRRPLQHRRSATRHVCRHLYAGRLRLAQAGRHRAHRRVHRHRERRAEGRRARRVDHGDGRQPAGGHAEQPAAAGGLARRAQFIADQSR